MRMRISDRVVGAVRGIPTRILFTSVRPIAQLLVPIFQRLRCTVRTCTPICYIFRWPTTIAAFFLCPYRRYFFERNKFARVDYRYAHNTRAKAIILILTQGNGQKYTAKSITSCRYLRRIL